jgi:heat shock protein HslJ
MRLRRGFVALAVVAAGCGTSAGTNAPVSTTGTTAGTTALRGHTYLSDSVSGRALVPGTQVSLEFKDTGELTARAGCNTMFAPATLDGGTVVVGDLATTEMGCEQARADQDQWLSGVLRAKPAWRLDGSVLHITSGSTEIVLSEKQDLPLAGPKWKLDTLIHGAVASSVRVNAWVSFDDKKITMNLGCNEGSAEYQVSGQRLQLSNVVTTTRPCPYDPDRTEEAILAVLNRAADFKIDGNALTLTNPADGAGLKFQALTR